MDEVAEALEDDAGPAAVLADHANGLPDVRAVPEDDVAFVLLHELGSEPHELVLIRGRHAVDGKDAQIGLRVAEALEETDLVALARRARAGRTTHVRARERDAD